MSLSLFQPGQRINVVGVTGSGKTTLARRLSARLGIPHVELDALFWGPDWTETPDDVFRKRVRQALAGERWVVDGNYSRIRDIIWPRADTIIWLDYSFPRVFARLFRRSLGRVFSQEALWHGNREGWRNFASRDSIFLWQIKTYRSKRQRYLTLMRRPEYAHPTFIHLTSPEQTEVWLSS